MNSAAATDDGAQDSEEDDQHGHEHDIDHLQREAQALDVGVELLADVLELLLRLRLLATRLEDGTLELLGDELTIRAALALKQFVQLLVGALEALLKLLGLGAELALGLGLELLDDGERTVRRTARTEADQLLAAGVLLDDVREEL